MSDRSVDLQRSYDRSIGRAGKDVQPYSRALFPIPEYPEYEAAGMWTVARALLSSLARLSPATLLTFIWGQYHLVHALLGRIQTAVRSLIFPSDADEESVLRWVSESGPAEVTTLEQVWRRGWILCALVERAMPSACGGHQRTLLSIEHAQTLAEQYLGVQPVFSRQELESQESLSMQQQRKLAHYLDRLRHALGRISLPVSKPNTPRVSSESQAYTLDYVARGIGLCAAQTNKKMCFKVYPTTQQCMEPGEINVLIRGPSDTYGTAVINPLYGRAQLLRQAFLGLDVKTLYEETTLPLTQGNTYLRSYGKTDFRKTFYIPKDHRNIDIEIIIRRDHVKVSYLASMDGIYEISLTSQGYNLIGSPFRVIATEDNFDINASADFDDDNECGIVDINNDKRVIFRIVDFVTEKMILNNNGTLEKISDDEATQLISAQNNGNNNLHSTNNISQYFSTENMNNTKIFTNNKSFQAAVNKVITMIHVCNAFKSIVINKNKVKHDNLNMNVGIPDIVNSMIFDKHSDDNINRDLTSYSTNNLIKNEIQDETDLKIYPNNTLSLEEYTDTKCIPDDSQNTREFPIQTYTINKTYLQNIRVNEKQMINNCKEKVSDTLKSENSCVQSTTSVDAKPTENTTEFFLVKSFNFNEHCLKSDYRSVQNITPVNISIESFDDEPKSPTTSFIDIENIERPKTPILKILHGNIKVRDDPIFIEENSHTPSMYEERCKSNEFLNPFYIHEINHNISETISPTPPKIIDFHIGAPVSLHQMRKIPSPEPDMNSIILASTLEEALQIYDKKVQNLKQNKSQDGCEDTIFYSPLPLQEDDSTIIHNSNQFVNMGFKDLRDSAYVSIDEANMYADNNNNSETQCKSKVLEGDRSFSYCSDSTFYKTGPAEQEIWLECADIKTALDDSQEYDRFQSEPFEIRKSFCTPIIEEGEINRPPIQEDVVKQKNCCHEADTETELITATFTNDSKTGYMTTSEGNSLNKARFEEQYPSLEANSKCKEIAIKQTHNDVNSSSELVSDVKRHDTNEKKAVISEVQFLVTESFSASQALDSYNLSTKQNITDRIQVTKFGQTTSDNMVNERKKYWDTKIKCIEEINTAKQRKKSPSKKILVQNFNNDCNENFNNTVDTSGSKIVTEKNIGQIEKNHPPMSSFDPIISNHLFSSDEEDIFLHSEHYFPTRLDVTDEKLYEAFETSPKRFFGNCRNNILEKIDSFLGKVNTHSIDTCSRSISSLNNGIVSSRISMFNHAESMGSQETNEINAKKIQKSFNQSYSSKKKIILSQNTDTEVTAYFKVSGAEKNQLENNIGSKLKKENQNNKNKNRKLYGSKSEMDIFNRVENKPITANVNKSCEDLPKINVRQFISMFEKVTTPEPNCNDRPVRNITVSAQKNTVNSDISSSPFTTTDSSNVDNAEYLHKSDKECQKNLETESSVHSNNEETKYLENITDEQKPVDVLQTQPIKNKLENGYKQRFKIAKEFFQSLEELRTNTVMTTKLNECEIILYNQSTKVQSQCKQPVYKLTNKPHSASLPYYDNEADSKGDNGVWNDVGADGRRFIKISEKFQVEDLFDDVAGEGKLSRHGSFRGIPNKRAVLAAFKSMENVTDLTSYEMGASQLSKFAEENNIKEAQTYLAEYPYLPRTEPSKYRSRVDIRASGLISRSELLKQNPRPRRNSVPDAFRLNEMFTATL